MPPSQFDISWEQFRSIPVALPPLAEQRAIANFLDAETARIDGLVAKKRRMAGLVEEHFQTYIRTRLATIDRVLPLKRSWRVVDCKHRTPAYVENGYPVVCPGDVTPGRLDLTRAHRFVDELDYRDLADLSRRPRPGDIIYSRNASIGIASFVDTDEPFCMGQDVCLITSRSQDQLYLSYVLNSIGVDQLEEHKIGSTFSRINIRQVVELRVPTPDVKVQRAMSREFDHQHSLRSKAASSLDRQIALLREHVQALISAAVMGELE